MSSQLQELSEETGIDNSTVRELKAHDADLAAAAARVRPQLDQDYKLGHRAERQSVLRRLCWTFLDRTHLFQQAGEADGLENIQSHPVPEPSRLAPSVHFSLDELRDFMDDDTNDSWTIEEVFRQGRHYATQLETLRQHDAQNQTMEKLMTTRSQVVEQFQERVKELREQRDSLSDQLERLEREKVGSDAGSCSLTGFADHGAGSQPEAR